MKWTWRILRNLFSGIALFIFLLATGLLITFHFLYKAPLPLPERHAFEFGVSSVTEPFDVPFVLVPVPRSIEFSGGYFTFPSSFTFTSLPEDRGEISRILEQEMNLQANGSGPASIKFIKDPDLPGQGYSMDIMTGGIEITYGDVEGLFYSVITLRQIMDQTGSRLPALSLNDWPDLPVRGIMIDISRDKIPSMETLYGIIDLLSLMKYNHLQLYVEGFSFAYESFKELWEETETPVTGEEILELDRYCTERFIDLVPNQNSLGHMNAWLATEEFADLAECPDGFKLLGLIEYKSTLDVSDPRSMELVKKMTEDMLPWFSSDNFNANLDEPFEIGKCKNRELAAEVGEGQLYIDYVKELNEFIRGKEKKMMIWGDIITKHPEIIPQVPDDLTLLEWGYESVHPFDNICSKYDEAGINYMVCPGTSTWTTFTGRTGNMKENIANAVGSGIKYNAKGMLLTDWGDMGHWQYWPVSFAPIVYGAALGWNFDSRDDLPLATFLNRMIFRDSEEIMGDFVLDMGNYNQFEEYQMVNMTTTFMTYMFGIMDKIMIEAIQRKLQTGLFDLISYEDELSDKIKSRFENPAPYDCRSIIEYTGELTGMLRETNMDRPDAQLIIDEYENAARMINLGALTKRYILYRRESTTEENIETLQQMKQLCTDVINEHKRLWLERNRSGGLDRSLASLRNLDNQISIQLDLMNRNRFSRFFAMTGEKLTAAAAALYIGMLN